MSLNKPSTSNASKPESAAKPPPSAVTALRYSVADKVVKTLTTPKKP